MKYYLVEIATGDSKVAGKAIYEYSTLNEAVATFHTKLGSAMKSPLYNTELLMVIDSEGSVYKNEFFVKPIEPTEE